MKTVALLFFLLCSLKVMAQMDEKIFVFGEDTFQKSMHKSSSLRSFALPEIESKQSLEKLLSGEAAFSFAESSFGGSKSLFVRGADSKHTALVLDGILLNDPSDPNDRFAFSNLSLSGLERVEVYKGNYSNIYSPSSIGGLVLLYSRQEAKDQKISLARGSDNLFRFKSFNSFTKENWNTWLSLDHFSSDGISVKGDRDSGYEKDPFRKQQVFARTNYRFNEVTSLSFLFRHFVNQAETDSSDGDDQYDFVDYDSDLYHLVFQKNRFRVGTGVYQSDRESLFSARKYTVATDKTYAFIDQKLRFTETADISYRFELDAAQIKISSLSEDKKQSHQAFSFLYEQDLNNSLFVSFAPRVDHYEDVDTNYTAAFLFGKKHSFWEVGIGLRRAAKAPSLYNLYDPTYGNVDLKPEFSEQVEVYMNYKMASQWEWAASFYKTNIKDRIDTDYSNPYENTGSYLLLGGEIEVKKSFYNGINFRLSEAYVNAENLETGKTLYGRPREVQSLFVGHTVNKHYYSLGLRHEKGIVSYGDILLDDFVLADFNYQYQLGKNAKLNFEIANLLNQHYQRVANFNSRARNYLLEYSVSY